MARLTPHQAEVYNRFRRQTAAVRSTETNQVIEYRWTSDRQFGCAGALNRLRMKGLLETRETRGPRGGWITEYRCVLSGDEAAEKGRILGLGLPTRGRPA